MSTLKSESEDQLPLLWPPGNWEPGRCVPQLSLDKQRLTMQRRAQGELSKIRGSKCIEALRWRLVQGREGCLAGGVLPRKESQDGGRDGGKEGGVERAWRARLRALGFLMWI